MMIILHTGHVMAFTANDFLIQNTSLFIDRNKIIHVYGEVKNISDKAMTNIVVKAIFYNANGKPLDEFQRSSELNTINPGETSPFEILYINTKTVNSVKDFKLSASGTVIEESKPIVLKVQPDNSRLDILGFYYINGRILNGGPSTATDSSVIATLYDKGGKVIAIGRALAEPVNIGPDSQAAFGLAVTEKLQTHKIKSYSLIAESDQYVSLPVLLSK
ncbi:MAG TPA: FxLYD domain-containing protein [Nitrososphaeraceae archaeon]|nr:FxLYD domain-containing protein [Nitrososphaeraceae archaeon]